MSDFDLIADFDKMMKKRFYRKENSMAIENSNIDSFNPVSDFEDLRKLMCKKYCRHIQCTRNNKKCPMYVYGAKLKDYVDREEDDLK